ncbi:MAG: NAD-dependent epimerase/dehydratase family protein [Armatimonadota bacterium]|nr:NAD-dependent epimerase/dehydratase family protein [Armatimonadota bacterium]
MKVLVTGGAGFIGSHTVDLLLQRGYSVRILDALLPPVHTPGHLPEYVPVGEVDFVQGDVRNRADWERALDGVEAVFHLAAYQDYLPDFSRFFHTNTVSTALLYELIVERRLPVRKVVVASSQAVYGEGKYRCKAAVSGGAAGDTHGVYFPPPRAEEQLRRGDWEVHCPQCGAPMEPQWTDEAVVNPHNQYAISKYTQEMVALNLGRRYNIPTVCMRYSIVQGPRQAFRNAYSGALRVFVQRLLHGRPPVCYEDGQQLRDYVAVQDVARANIHVLEDPRADFQVLNVGGDRRISVLEYARLVSQRARVELSPHVPGLYRFGDTRHIFSDVGKLRALGWEPLVPLERVVDEYIAWAQDQADFRDYSEEAEARMRALGVLRPAGRSVT